jgi:hypothetical protein
MGDVYMSCPKKKPRFFNQPPRPGWNLVLQLNFSSQHNRSYTKLIKPKTEQPFQSYGHPVAGIGYHPLAWARIDMDLNRRKGLIEESRQIELDW